MMLAASALFSASQVVAAVFSPSSSCKKRVTQSRYRYDPYCARVIPGEWYASTIGYAAESMPLSMFTPTSADVVADAICSRPRPPSPLRSNAVHTSPTKAAAAPSTTAAVAAPKVAVPPAGPRYVIIRFKHETQTFVAPFRIAVGDTVVVEGDRGENIGTVEEIFVEKPSYEVSNKIMRRATEKDKAALAAQRQREAAVTKATQALADSLGLHATIEDAEYQFDLNKLTIFVRRSSQKTFVDFRKLQRGLFREFRCRIWCAYMDEVEAAELAPRTR